MKTCTLCEQPDCAVEVAPEKAKWLIYMCRDCARAVSSAWGKQSGPTWVKVNRAKLAEVTR